MGPFDKWGALCRDIDMPCASDLPGSLSRTFVCTVERKENGTHVFSVRVLSEPVAVHPLGDATLLVSPCKYLLGFVCALDL